CKVEKQAVFCLSENMANACMRVLHGKRTEQKPAYAFGEANLLGVLNIGDAEDLPEVGKEDLNAALGALREAFYKRDTYDQNIVIKSYAKSNGQEVKLPGGINFVKDDDFGFTVTDKKIIPWFSQEGMGKLFEMTRAHTMTHKDRENASFEWRM